MKLKKPLSLFLFLAGALAAGSLIINCSHPAKKEAPPAAAQAQKTVAEPVPVEKVSVDFENTPLSEVVQFITAKTHVKFVFDGLGSTPITWQEFDIPSSDLVRSFDRVLELSGIHFNPLERDVLLTKEKSHDALERLDFAISDKGTFFLYRGRVYEGATLPCSLRHINGQWFAIVSQPFAEPLDQAQRLAKNTELPYKTEKKIE